MKKILTFTPILSLFIAVAFSHAYAARQITYNDFDDTSPMISNNSDIVWLQDIGWDTQIQRWNIYSKYQDFSNITWLEERQLQMSANGNVVWQTYNDDTNEYEIIAETYPYNGIGQNISLSPNHKDKDPDINDNGHVVWLKYVNYSFDVYLYDGVERRKLTHNGIVNISDNADPQINNNSR